MKKKNRETALGLGLRLGFRRRKGPVATIGDFRRNRKNRERASGLGFVRRKGPVVTIGDLRRNITGDDEKKDRLSTLPDDIIHRVFSFISCKYAVRTSVLSKRWVNIWTTLPYLNFVNLRFEPDNVFHIARFKPPNLDLERFNDKFVRQFLNKRNHQYDIFTFKIDLQNFGTKETIDIVQYVLSHHARQLHILAGDNLRFPLSYELLTTLHLSHCGVNLMDCNFPCLSTLHLMNVAFRGNETVLSFERFENLKELALVGGRELHFVNEITINCSSLLSLTISEFDTIIYSYPKFVVSAPILSHFKFGGTGGYLPVLSTGDGFPCLKEMELSIHIDEEDWEYFFPLEKRKQLVQELIHIFHKFHGAKFLNLSFATIQALSRVPDFSEYQPSPYCNLESLNLLHSQQWQNYKLTRSIDHVIKYLLSNSPCAKIFIQDFSDRKFKKYNPKEDTLRRDIHGYHLMKSK